MESSDSTGSRSAERRVAISGASGWLASHLIPQLEADGWRVARLVRPGGDSGPGDVCWDLEADTIDRDALEGVDAVIHLAGENVAGRRWNEAHKRKVLQSRETGTRLLCGALALLKRPPQVLVSASAIGWYGDRGDLVLDESSARGTGFLSDVCAAWEAATTPASEAGIRVVHARVGVVLGRDGGPLGQALSVFQMAMGGRFGDGRQYMSWIALPDVAAALRHCMVTERLRGPVNLTAPEPVTNAEFTRALAAAVRRPALLHVPAFALRALLGREMADELLLSSARVRPAKLLDSGFDFAHPEIRDALEAVIR